MRAFVVLSLVFSTPSQEIGLEKRLRHDLICIKWDVKPQLNQLIKQHGLSIKLNVSRNVDTSELFVFSLSSVTRPV